MRGVGTVAKALTIILLAACGNPSVSDDEAGGEIPLPVPLPAHSPTYSMEEWATRLSNAEETVAIGSLDAADPRAVIGEVVDADVDAAGNVLVLDRSFNELKVFRPTGEVFEVVGGEGQGPGEFMGAVTMVRHADGTLTVFDQMRRGHHFAHASDGAMEFLDTAPNGIAVGDACALPGAVWLQGKDDLDGSALERLHSTTVGSDSITGAIAPGPPSEHPILQTRRLEGFVDCLATGSDLLLTSRYFPEVEGYRPNGTQLWATTLPDFIPMEFTVVERGGLRQSIHPDAGGFHWIVGAVVLDRGTALVQAGWQTSASSREGSRYTSLDSYLISMESGKVVGLEGDLPLVVTSLPDGFLATRADPFPQVLRYTYASSR